MNPGDLQLFGRKLKKQQAIFPRRSPAAGLMTTEDNKTGSFGRKTARLYRSFSRPKVCTSPFTASYSQPTAVRPDVSRQ